MSEYRHDPVYDHWVIIAPNREGRPEEFIEAGWQRIAWNCPFCVGHEEDTPPELARYSLDGQTSWQVRVVPNKYPAVTSTCGWPPEVKTAHSTLPGYGVHEVIIESPHHTTSLCELPLAALALVLRAYRDRLRAVRQRQDLAYGIVFKNVGAAAGASLEHIHSQVLATVVVPPPIAGRWTHWKTLFCQTGQTALSRWLDEELQSGQRLVGVTSHFAAVCPFASRMPMELRLAPLTPEPYFEAVCDARLEELAQLLSDVLLRLEVAVPNVAYNLIVHTAPLGSGPHDYCHWYIEILPRLTRAAGFEWGTGCFINPVKPEEAARRLRDALPPSRTRKL